MRFNFSEDQLLLQQTVRDFLQAEHTPEHVRALWETETRRSPEFWAKLAEIGVPGLRVPEKYGGLEMDEVDLVLVLEETGHVALAEPVIPTAVVGVPLLVDLEARGLDSRGLCAHWLPKVAEGEAILAVGHSESPFVSDAHVADLLLLASGDELHAVSPGDARLTLEPASDPSQRLVSVEWTPSADTRVADGEAARALAAASLDRGALACAAQQLGVGQKLIEMAVEYACERKQFGVPIGSFQAIKHMLADVKVKLEYARSVVYRAAYSVARDTRCRAVDVSMAKLAACEPAVDAAKIALQVYGALGYTWEQDLHIWLRRAWSLDLAFGDGAFHRARVSDGVIDGALPAENFGYSAPSA